MYRTSALLSRHGFAHGFSDRSGGASRPPFDSLNFGRNVGDDAEAVRQNHARFEACIGYQGVYEASQVHGSAVLLADGASPEVLRQREADAVLTRIPSNAVGVRTADCVPLLAADPESGAVVAIHAGWRGVVAGVVPAALEALGARAPVVAIGPHIRGPSFEVGPEVSAAIARASGIDPVVGTSAAGRPLVDLSAAIIAQLARVGVPRDDVDDVGGCTLTEPQHFYSFRRDGKASGRHLSVIVAR